jgi:DeoR/GlpR family transcriptional regulator of sugar metabolism
MEGINERQMKILTQLNENGFVRVQNLCESFDVSSVTIRKDLSFLETKGLLFRTHGGASKQSLYAFERNIGEKEAIQVDQKKTIAEKSLQLINNRDYIILGSGTTILYLARLLEGFEKLTVVTSSLFVSVELCNYPNITAIQLGGNVRKSSNSVIGSTAEQIISDYSCNKAFLGVDGIDIDFGLSTSNALEAQLNKTMINASEKVIVMADSSKIGKRSFGKIADIQDIDVLVTDSGISKKDQTALEKLGIEVITA